MDTAKGIRVSAISSVLYDDKGNGELLTQVLVNKDYTDISESIAHAQYINQAIEFYEKSLG